MKNTNNNKFSIINNVTVKKEKLLKKMKWTDSIEIDKQSNERIRANKLKADARRDQFKNPGY